MTTEDIKPFTIKPHIIDMSLLSNPSQDFCAVCNTKVTYHPVVEYDEKVKTMKYFNNLYGDNTIAHPNDVIDEAKCSECGMIYTRWMSYNRSMK